MSNFQAFGQGVDRWVRSQAVSAGRLVGETPTLLDGAIGGVAGDGGGLDVCGSGMAGGGGGIDGGAAIGFLVGGIGGEVGSELLEERERVFRDGEGAWSSESPI